VNTFKKCSQLGGSPELWNGFRFFEGRGERVRQTLQGPWCKLLAQRNEIEVVDSPGRVLGDIQLPLDAFPRLAIDDTFASSEPFPSQRGGPMPERFVFSDLRELFAKPNEEKSVEELLRWPWPGKEGKKAGGPKNECIKFRGNMDRFAKLAVLICLLLALALAGCTPKAAPPSAVPVIPVMAAKAVVKAMPIELHEIGTGEAYSTVSIESQVAGIVSAVHYVQGQFVKKGDLLVSLDDRPFVAALEMAQANLAKDRANAALAGVQAERYEKLFQSGVVPKEQLDQELATEAADKAAVQADEAAVKAANLNVSFCSIYAPIDGQTGSQLVYPGAVVKADDVPVLVVINRISPMYVDFSVPQQYLDQIKSYMAHERLLVQAAVSDNSAPESGYLTFVNNTVNASTGTILLKGTFANRDRRLWPGEFVNVVLRLAEQENAIVVPSQAVMNGQDGDYLFVIKPDMTVDLRTVKVSRTVNGESVITDGVKPGESVVTDGQLRLTAGAKVRIRTSL
jgi:membrane fusion protein, multidrug efflux system